MHSLLVFLSGNILESRRAGARSFLHFRLCIMQFWARGDKSAHGGNSNLFFMGRGGLDGRPGNSVSGNFNVFTEKFLRKERIYWVKNT